MELKFIKKMIAVLCAGVMTTSCAFGSVGAVDTTEGEMDYSLMYIDKVLPKTGDVKEFLDLSKYNNLKHDRLEIIKHENGETEEMPIDEVVIYGQIKKTVQSLIDKVDERTPGNPKYKGKSSQNLDKPRDWRIAKAIYRWVAKNIRYDWEMIKKDKYGNKRDALYTFALRQNVCMGYSELIALMMKMANIPCVQVGSLANRTNVYHVYNAVCLENLKDTSRKDWVLLDATDILGKDAYKRSNEQKEAIKESFPAFYRSDLSISDANHRMIARETHKIQYIIASTSVETSSLSVKGFFDGLISYVLSGTEGDACLTISANNPTPVKNVQISDEMLKFGLCFKVDKGIESLTLKSDETLDISKATDLKSIDTTHSNKYDGYDAKNKKLVYKKDYIDRLNKQLNDKIINEYNQIFNEHCNIIKSVGIRLNSPQDSTTEARKKAVDFVGSIYNNSVELNDESFNKANDLINEAIKQMKEFKKCKLRVFLEDKIINEYNPIHNEYCKFINSIGIRLNSPQDSATEARQKTVGFVDSIYNNSVELNDESFNKANDLINETIKQMKEFKWKYMNNLINS